MNRGVIRSAAFDIRGDSTELFSTGELSFLFCFAS